MGFNGRTIKDWENWRKAFREKLMELLGDWPKGYPINPETIEKVKEKDYIREKVVFDSEPYMSVPAYLLLPKGMKGKQRAILAIHGHGSGKVDICGLSETASEAYKNKYALEAVKRGYVVLAPDLRAFGERRYPKFSWDGCGDNVAFESGLLVGLNLLTLNIWDMMKSMDYLISRPEVDPERIGCIGLSYGGCVAAFTTALDERIKVGVVSGYLTTWKAGLRIAAICGAQTLPNILKYGEMEDIAALIAPRPVLYENGTYDDIVPIEGARKAFEKLKRIYRLLGAKDRIYLDEFPGPHMWNGKKAWDWLDKWL